MHFNKKWPSKRSNKRECRTLDRPAIDLTGSGLSAEHANAIHFSRVFAGDFAEGFTVDEFLRQAKMIRREVLTEDSAGIAAGSKSRSDSSQWLVEVTCCSNSLKPFESNHSEPQRKNAFNSLAPELELELERSQTNTAQWMALQSETLWYSQ